TSLQLLLLVRFWLAMMNSINAQRRTHLSAITPTHVTERYAALYRTLDWRRRQTADAERSRILRCRLRFRGGHLLSRLCAVRSTQQSSPAEDRCAQDHQPDNAVMGTDIGGDAVRAFRVGV